MTQNNLEPQLKEILKQYQGSFNEKSYRDDNDDRDVLMDVFGLTPDMKRENRQYWGRELGMCWQRLVTELFRITCDVFKPALRLGADEPCDCIVGNDAIDTKYRIGSGDSGTLKKFKQYGKSFPELGYVPVLLIVREDNLPAAITACKSGGWVVHQGNSTFEYIKLKSEFDLYNWLLQMRDSREFFVTR